MEQRLSIITIAVADLGASRLFYRRAFAWSEIEPAGEGIAFYQLPGIQFALYPRAEMAGEHGEEVGPPAGFTLAHTVNSRAEVDDIFTRVVEGGARPLRAPEEVFWGGYSGYVAGPDGEQWEIAFNPFTSVNTDGTFGSWSHDG